MKHFYETELNRFKGKPIDKNEQFSFSCYPEIACFNKCCRNLNLFLYPYDVIRLKKRLSMSSDDFIERYTDVVLRSHNFFPEVLLRMADNADKTCPFLSESGCEVYPDRPDTCRTFPIEHGLLFDEKDHQDQIVYFFRPPDFCLGQKESSHWTPETWVKDQQAGIYHEMTSKWARVKALFQNNPWDKEGPEGPKAKMAFMAVYNIDQFREFLFSSSFFKRYHVKSKIRSKLKSDDTELLLFGFDWVQFSLWKKQSPLFTI